MSHPPDWLSEPCPSWCCGDHEGQEHPADRRHFSDLPTVPVTTLVRHVSADHPSTIERDAAATDFTVELSRYVGDQDIWLFVGDEGEGIEVSLESARRLHRAMDEVLHAESTPQSSP